VVAMMTRLVVVSAIFAALGGCSAEVRVFGSGGGGGSSSSSSAASTSSSSASSSTASSTASSSSSSSGMPDVCGDGMLGSTEGCDDGNTVDGDGCSSMCAVETAYDCTGSPSVCVPKCGDGVLLAGERCDDGNPTDGDGCSATCTVEPYWRCAGTPSVCARIKIVYSPSSSDDTAYRASIAAVTGGLVDFLDPTTVTPTAAQLQAYDCVYTWASVGYFDKVAFGDALADFVDAGGNVVLGAFTTYTMGSYLSGKIMTAGYNPVVSPTGNNHLMVAPYAGDGTTFIHSQVTAYASTYRDILVLQGTGVMDGTYTDGEIAQAYRADFKVVYSNGVGLAGDSDATGDWPRLVANACAVGFLQ
jgi:cysteine-rich repeat protein